MANLLDRRKRVIALCLMLGIGAASVTVRWLFANDLSHSGMLYIGVPYLIAVALLAFMPMRTERWWHGYLNLITWALILFLGSSIVLYEGFICVIFFIPLYLLIITLIFLFHAAHRFVRSKRAKAGISVFPVLLLLSAAEGTTPEWSLPRSNSVTVVASSTISIEQIHANLSGPINMDVERSLLLTIFPMPYEVITPPIATGAIHRAKTHYARWFVTNVVEGEIALIFDEVSRSYIRTRVLRDTSHFAGYLRLHGTEITLRDADGTTDIELTIHYTRRLDPAWYFHPLMQRAMGQMGQLLIEEVLLRD
ncbi:MAG: hypothetical protein AAF513_12000 [Pseudomonadota bacterium]